MLCFASLFILIGGKQTEFIKLVLLDSCRKSGLPSLGSNKNSQTPSLSWQSITVPGVLILFPYKDMLIMKKLPSLFLLSFLFFPLKCIFQHSYLKPAQASFVLSQAEKLRGLIMKTSCRNGPNRQVKHHRKKTMII